MIIPIKTHYYQNFDADYTLEYPGEGYGGWKSEMLEIDTDHTAFVFFQNWDHGTREMYPGWYRAVEYIERENKIEAEVFPSYIKTLRDAGQKIYHVVGTRNHYSRLPGYQETAMLTDDTPYPKERIERDETVKKLLRFRSKHVHPGEHNIEDIDKGFSRLDFPHATRPIAGEAIAANEYQLAALCRRDKVSHLIYAGFTINIGMLAASCGMINMGQYGIMCSVVKEGVTAVENKESARLELHKEESLWRTSYLYGFVYSVEDIKDALRTNFNLKQE